MADILNLEEDKSSTEEKRQGEMHFGAGRGVNYILLRKMTISVCLGFGSLLSLYSLCIGSYTYKNS